MSTPQAGDNVRLVRTCGASAPTMRRHLGKVGTVLEARTERTGVLVHVRFATPDDVDDRFWLKPGEWEVPVSDFAATVQAHLDGLAAEDAAAAAQMTELATRRGAIGRELKALEAARSAYQRAQQSGTERREPGGARETRAVVFVRRWAREHDGLVVLAEAIPAAERADVAPTPEQVRDRITWAARRHGQRTGKGVYRLAVPA